MLILSQYIVIYFALGCSVLCKYCDGLGFVRVVLSIDCTCAG